MIVAVEVVVVALKSVDDDVEDDADEAVTTGAVTTVPVVDPDPGAVTVEVFVEVMMDFWLAFFWGLFVCGTADVITKRVNC